MTTLEVAVEHPAQGVGLIRIDRPQSRNALSMQVRALIAASVTNLVDDDAIRCIVLTGNGRYFVSGGDIKEMAGADSIRKMAHDARKKRLWRAITECPKPVIAAVNGFALGGGCELAMMCDIIVAGESVRFGQPEVKLGVIPGSGGTQRLARVAGKYRALRYLLTGDAFSARQALDMGLVSEVVADADVERCAVELAARIAGLAPLAVQQAKEVVLLGLEAPLATGLALEAKASQLLYSSQDQKEGRAAFIEKRRPRFQGK